ncbi:unnamed protein product [Rotaria sp. Silwood1]|nr:unnamed protein product [Rotaria sp. Silwood1]
MLELELPLPSIVYRGTQMSKTDIELFRESKNCLISPNGFLSTTRNREVAQFYAGSGVSTSRRRGEIHAVIFELVIPSDVQSIVFADISYLSKMIDEQEFLFDIGTTFIVSDVTYADVEQTWIIRLIGSDQGRNIVSKEYIEFYREHTKYLSPTIKLGESLAIVGRLAWIDQCQGKYKDAQAKLDLAYELEDQNGSPCQQMLRNIIVDNGTIHLLMGQPNLALNCYLRADKMGSSSAIFNNIGLAYRQKRQWEKALEFFNKALARDQQDWPNGHYRIGITLDNIGRVYNAQALNIKERLDPIDRLLFAQTLHNLGIAYADSSAKNDQQDDKKAFEYFQRALSMHEANGSAWSPDAAATLYEQARLHERREEYREALELFIQARNIQQATLPRNHRQTTETRIALIGLKIEL